MGLDTLKTVWQGQWVTVGGQLGVMAACLGVWSRCKRWDVTQRAGCPSAHDAIHPVHATFHPEYGVALHGLVTHLDMPLEPGDVFPMALIPVPKNDEE
jgi:hypothetical protein